MSSMPLQPDTVTGDIVFILQVKEHPRFKRKYDDLFIEHTVSLTEALCGFQFILTHLDGRQLLIKSNPGEIIKPGMFPVFGFPTSLWSLNSNRLDFYKWLTRFCSKRSTQGYKRRGCATVWPALHEGPSLCGIQRRVS